MRSIALSIFCMFGLFAQAQQTVRIKEQYDFVTHKMLYGGGSYSGVVSYMVDNASPWNTHAFGEEVGGFLEGYLRMYETTKDKAYLIRFVNLSLKAMAWRNANYSFSQFEYAYMDGLMARSLAHFVHLVLIEEPNLGVQVIPEDLIQYQTSTVAGNVLPYQADYTYAELADWFMDRCMETLDAIIDLHWTDEETFSAAWKILGVNQEAGFAAAMLYLGRMSAINGQYAGLDPYLTKSAMQIALFRGNEPQDRCNCISGSPILMPGNNNSYYWHHEGWSYPRRNCPFVCQGNIGVAFDEPNLEDRHEFTEDISHAVLDLQIPLLADRFNLYTNGSEPFEEAELVKFRNTFTKRVAVWTGWGWGFHNSVEGYDSPVYPSSYDGNFNALGTIALGWMPLHKYDNSPGAESGPTVYDIISDYYSAEIFNTPTKISGGLLHQSLAEVVAAQWEYECFDLTLFNRELPYDQDFAARHVLTIHPAGEVGMSFSDPQIPDARFTILGGVHSTHRAGGAVIWYPGFEAQYGSVVEAVIDPLGCGLAYRGMVAPQNERLIVHTATAERKEEAVKEQPSTTSGLPNTVRNILEVVPNPSQGNASAWITLVQVSPARIRLIDATGRQVWAEQLGTLGAGEHRITLPSSLGTGIYLCRVDLENMGLEERVVVE